MSFIKNIFGCRWEKVAHRNSWRDDISAVPNWVEKAYWKEWKKGKSLYGTASQFKGKTFVYKVVTKKPMTMGQTPRVYYRRLRYKAFKRREQ